MCICHQELVQSGEYIIWGKENAHLLLIFFLKTSWIQPSPYFLLGEAGLTQLWSGWNLQPSGVTVIFTSPLTHPFIPHIVTACSVSARLWGRMWTRPTTSLWNFNCQLQVKGGENAYRQPLASESQFVKPFQKCLQTEKTRNVGSLMILWACCPFEGKEMTPCAWKAEEGLNGGVRLSRA